MCFFITLCVPAVRPGDGSISMLFSLPLLKTGFMNKAEWVQGVGTVLEEAPLGAHCLDLFCFVHLRTDNLFHFKLLNSFYFVTISR